MDAAEAISRVTEWIEADGSDYPTRDLVAEAYLDGWCVYASSVRDIENPMAVSDEPRLSVFLVDRRTGAVEEVEDPDPDTVAEACLWHAASAPIVPDQGGVDVDLPSSPRIWGPRRPADEDREAVAVLARALARERSFAGWLAWQLAELADLLGGSDSLVARRRDVLFDEHLTALVDGWAEAADGPRDAWRNWPPVDPAALPEADTTGWVLTAIEPAATWLDRTDPDALTPEEMRLADTVFNRFQRIPRWRACGIVEYYPQLFPVRLYDREHPVDASSVHDLDSVLLAPSPDDPDVEALLRLAVDAERRHREVIDLDVAASACYRRVLDRFGHVLDPGI